MLYTNYFEVNLGLDQKIFQYHVSFKPEVENVRVKFQLITSLTEVVGTVRCFDGGILYLQRLLPKEVSFYESNQIMLGSF